MLEDRFGLPISTSSAEAQAAYVDVVDRILAADGGVDDAVEALLGADPEFGLGHSVAARQHQLRGRGKQAREAADTAVELAASATLREQRHAEVIRLLVSGKIPDSLAMAREHMAEFPRDAFVIDPACGVFGSIGFSGRIDREAEQLAYLEPLVDHYGDDWWFNTVYAFALLEVGEWRRARTLVEQALEQRPDSPHGGHTLAHALFESGDDDEALSFFDGWIPGLDRDSIMHCHNWWHYAMLLLTCGRHDQADAALADNCMPGSTTSASINVFTDAASYLWRAELAGRPRDPDRWQQVRDYYEEQFRRPIVYVDAHAGLPYAALGDSQALATCVQGLDELAAAGRLPADTVPASLARAYGAFVDERWSEVIDTIEPIQDQIVRIGGSRAQRDLVTNTLLAAYVNAERPDDAARVLASITDRQPSRPIAGLATA